MKKDSSVLAYYRKIQTTEMYKEAKNTSSEIKNDRISI